MRRQFPLLLLLGFVFVLVVAVTTAHGARRSPRAARILQPNRQTWICPEIPGGLPVVSREVCFILGWPEPTL